MRCCICFKDIEVTSYGWADGANAEPLCSDNAQIEGSGLESHGRCCANCDNIVIGVRIAHCMGDKDADKMIQLFRTAANQGDMILAHIAAHIKTFGMQQTLSQMKKED